MGAAHVFAAHLPSPKTICTAIAPGCHRDYELRGRSVACDSASVIIWALSLLPFLVIKRWSRTYRCSPMVLRDMTKLVHVQKLVKIELCGIEFRAYPFFTYQNRGHAFIAWLEPLIISLVITPMIHHFLSDTSATSVVKRFL